METVRAIIAHLEPLDFGGTIGLHLMCEPLLHKGISEIIRAFRDRLPKVDIRMESNGDVLDKDFERLEKLFEDGLNEILINCYDSKEQFDQRNKQILQLKSQSPSIWYWNQWLDFPSGARNEWRVVRMRAFFGDGHTLKNWAGHVALQRPEKIEFPVPLSCPRPFTRLHVNYLGQVVLYNCDWKYEVVAGDLNTQNLDEVWNAPVLVKYRRHLLNRERSLHLCRTCNLGVPMTNVPPVPPVDSWVRARRMWLGVRKDARRGAGRLRRLLGP